LQHLRGMVLGINSDRQERDLWAEIAAKLVLNCRHLRCQNGAGGGTGGEDEGYRDSLAAEFVQRDLGSVLCAQDEIGRRPDHRQPRMVLGSRGRRR
jgi:hypothetical protein